MQWQTDDNGQWQAEDIITSLHSHQLIIIIIISCASNSSSGRTRTRWAGHVTWHDAVNWQFTSCCHCTSDNNNLVTTLTFLGHVTSSMTSSFDPPWAISYKWVIGTKSLTQTVFEIFASKYWVLTDGQTDGKKHHIISRQFTPFTWRI